MRLTIRNSDGTVSQPMNLDWSAALEKLAAYEDAEENGLLVRLPCKIGDMVYYRRGRDIIGDTVDHIIIDNGQRYVELNCGHKTFWFEEFGKKAFVSRAEAEAALKGAREDV